ncbi:LPXTG cell wall anchor domain-containing protein [Polymorphospora lycopeni]|uniref:LPXTG cell wall anchor domain-containing protein n=1 Tax=Polymorphospora lycopeni TaxID=3140240 RepID=A0ABV5CQW6_9ACTN
MHVRTALRWTAAVAMAGALVAASAMPAAARGPDDAQLSVYMPDTTLATGTDGKTVSAYLYASKPVVLSSATIVYDFSDLVGTATVRPTPGRPNCTTANNRLTCGITDGIRVDESGIGGLTNVVIRPATGAVSGATGTLRVTFVSPGSSSGSYAATVRVGEAVDLAIGPDVEVQAEPGGAFSAPIAVTNPGDTAVEGFNVLFYHDHGFRPGEKYRNCTYVGDVLRSCAFDTTVQPGETLSGTMSYKVGEDAYAPGTDWAERQVMTRADFTDHAGFLAQVGFELGEPGDGGLLELVRPGAAARNAQTDIDETNNWSVVTLRVTGQNGADIAAIGDSARGAAGEVVTAEVGLVNNGPATVEYERSGEPVTALYLTVPPGSTVVEAPQECYPMNGERPDYRQPGGTGAAKYFCPTGVKLPVDEKQILTFKLRIDEVTADATGEVAINVPCECPWFHEDLDPANDVAKLVLNPAEPGGGGGGLPVTGATTAWTAAGGVLLLLAGTAGFVLFRRRRVRFIA